VENNLTSITNEFNHTSANYYYLGCGKIVHLENNRDIFMPSQAGIFFWETLYSRYFSSSNKDIKILELGTGSGFFSFALAALGFRNIVATDINPSHIDYATRMWDLNRKNNNHIEHIDFRVSNLFENIPEGDFDVIVFNAPGWGTPHESYITQLKEISGSQYYSMFEGDKIVKQSFTSALSKLKPNGSYFIGLNSISGISSLISSVSCKTESEESNISNFAASVGFTMLPLLLYNETWSNHKNLLLKQFDIWRKHKGGYYQVNKGVINWVYDVIEVKKKMAVS
jgi:release factor glutamine methyltransferase